MKIHRDIDQGDCGWELLRSGKVTASELDALVTPLGKVKTGEGPKTYLAKKVAEIWTGGPLPSTEFWDGQQGQFLEEFARPAFTFQTGLDVEQVGFISTDNGRMGCSPDGLLVGQECGLEIKAPHLETHVRYLLDGVLPPDYVLQVQGSLYVTQFPRWYFMSYRRSLPPLILTIEPDEKIQAAIEEATGEFFERLDAAIAKLTELNGGFRPPPSYHPATPETDAPAETMEEVIP